MADLSERKKKILQILIQHYICTAQPVGSKTVAENYRLGLSPATIRNCMAELEEEGYLIHPYTSAGRIPADKGYRLYVDNLIEAQRLVIEEEKRIRHEYYQHIRKLEDILNYTSYLLARLSHYTGFVFSPKWGKSVLQSLHFLSVGKRKILVTLTTQSGMVKHSLFESESEVNEEKLRHLTQILSRRFSGLPLSELKEKIYQKVEEVEKEYLELMELAKKLLRELFIPQEKEEVYFEGLDNILTLPEFKDTEKLSNLFKFIEEKKLFSFWLKKELGLTNRKRMLEEKKVKVSIGSENPFPEFQDCSLVSSVYQMDQQPVGILGILGPKRMEYSRMIALVSFISQLVDKILNKSLEKKSKACLWEKKGEQ